MLALCWGSHHSYFNRELVPYSLTFPFDHHFITKKRLMLWSMVRTLHLVLNVPSSTTQAPKKLLKYQTRDSREIQKLKDCKKTMKQCWSAWLRADLLPNPGKHCGKRNFHRLSLQLFLKGFLHFISSSPSSPKHLFPAYQFRSIFILVLSCSFSLSLFATFCTYWGIHVFFI